MDVRYNWNIHSMPVFVSAYRVHYFCCLDVPFHHPGVVFFAGVGFVLPELFFFVGVVFFVGEIVRPND